MSTRKPLPILVFALLALGASRVQAQQPAPPAAEAPPTTTAAPAPATDAGPTPPAPTPPADAPPAITLTPAPAPAATPAAPAPAEGALADKPAATDAIVVPAPPPATPPGMAPVPGAVPAPSAATAAAAAAAAASKSKDAAGRDTLSVDFPDEDIRNILRNVADLFELNIIMPDTLQGKTTIKLRDVTWRQIFESVLTPVGYTYREDGNIIKIVSNESLTQEPVSTDVFLINYAKASDILPTVQSLVDAASGGRIVVDARSNALVITERSTRMNRIRPLIEQLDRPTDQVMIESKFVEVTDSDVKNIGVNWASLANVSLTAGPLNASVNRARGQTLSDTTDGHNNNTNTDTTLTTVGNTTTVTNGQTSGSSNTSSVTSTNGTPSNTSTTGTNGTLNNSTTVSGTNGVDHGINNVADTALNLLNNIANTGSTDRTLSSVFSASQFQLVLSALQQLQKTKIISNPTIVTLNNTEASINVGQERPIPSYTYNQQQGSYEISGFTYKPIGVILKVTPQVNSRGFIRLTINPEVSQSTRDVDFRGASIPVVETRKAQSQVSLKDGYTMGIGGLLQTTSRNGTNKVPVLGSIPVLGRLFRSDNKNEDMTNLIIFITAKTVSAEGAPIEQVFSSEQVRSLNMKREDLPGYRDGSNPFVSESKPGEKPEAKKSFFRPSTPEAKK